MPLDRIAIDLIANAGAFIEGMTRASSAAKKFGKEVNESFSRVGELAESALAPFGELGTRIAETFTLVGRLADEASQSLSKMSGGMSYLAASAGVAAGALAGVTASTIALAIHTAESVREMAEMAESAGVSVESFSSLSFAAKQAGVQQDVLTKGLGNMSKTMLKAATDVPGTATAYSRLGLSVKDTNGHLKDADVMLREVIGKLDELKSGTEKVGFAREIFGKSGQEFVKFNPAELEEAIDAAKRLHIVIDKDLADASIKFMQSMNEIEAAGKGAAILLTKELLPAIQAVANALKNEVGGSDSNFQTVIKDLAVVAKLAITVGDTFLAGFLQISKAVGAVMNDIANFSSTLAVMIEKGKSGDWSGVAQAAKDGFSLAKANLERFNADSKKIWQDNANFIENIYGPRAPFTVRSFDNNGNADLGPQPPRSNAVAAEIGKLLEQMQAEGMLATAISGTTANTLLAVAAAEAQRAIGEVLIKAAKERIKVTEEEKTAIRDAITFTQAYKAVYEDNKKLQEFIDKTKEQTKALLSMAAAYADGANSVIAGAKQAEAIEPFKKQADDLKELIELLKQGKTDEFTKSLKNSISSLSKIGASAEELKPLRDALNALTGGRNPLDPLIHGYEELTERLKTATEAERQKNVAAASEVANKALSTLGDEIEFEKQHTVAILAGAEALRKYNVEKQVKVFEDQNAEKGILVSPTDIAKYRESVTARIDGERNVAAAQQIAAIQSFKATQDHVADIKLEIQSLENQRLTQLKLGEDTASVDKQLMAASLTLYEEKIKAELEFQKYLFDGQNAQVLGAAQIYEAWQKNIEQWDTAVANDPFATLGERFKAMTNQMQLEGQNLGKNIFATLSKSLNDISSELAKFVVTGQSNFRKMFQGLEEQLVKSSFQKLFSSMLGQAFGGPGASPSRGGPWSEEVPGKTGGVLGSIGSIFGFGGKGNAPTGTRSNPLYVSMADGAFDATKKFASIPAGDGGDGSSDSSSSPLSGIFSKISGAFSSVLSGVTGVLSKLGGMFSGIFGSFGKIFGGFLASGGDVTPGKAYVVGENHPEFFVPKQAGQVTPYLKTGGPSHQTSVTMHIHGVTDFDSFKRSSGQIMAGLQRQIAIAHARNS